jgi:hypothetical protein
MLNPTPSKGIVGTTLLSFPPSLWGRRERGVGVRKKNPLHIVDDGI